MAMSLATVLMTVLSMAFQQSDTTITVAAGDRLDVESMGGSIVVGTWDRNEVRVQATHGTRDVVNVETRGSVVRVRTERSRGFGFSGIVDYQITVPATMDLELDGVNVAITVEGTRGRVNAESVQGDITLRGGRGEVSLETVMGRVEVDGVQGAVRAASVAGGMRVRNVIGEIEAESVSGSVVIENVTSSSVNASSVSGRIYYDGIIANDGRYSFASHSGSITLAVQPDLNATISLALLSGSFSSSIGSMTGATGDRGRRQTFTVGAGSALVELESFSGTIRIARRGEVSAPTADASGAMPGLGFDLDNVLNSIF
jgi:DUF4097 and DUF4098 domain-containing protein YvlB